MINELLASPFILKLGVGLQNDVEKLCNDHQSVCGNAPDAVVPLVWPFCEIQSLPFGGVQTISLAQMVSINLKLSLQKEQQTSDWGLRPLTAEQREYAALDAWILLSLFDALLLASLSLSHLPTCSLATAPSSDHDVRRTVPLFKTRVVPTQVAAVEKSAQVPTTAAAGLGASAAQALGAGVDSPETRYLIEVLCYLRSLPAGTVVPLAGVYASSMWGVQFVSS